MKFKKILTAVLSIMILLSAMGAAQAYAKDLTIKDIQPSDEAYSTVQWVINQGYMSLTLGKFLPQKFVKRSEFAAIVTKLSGSGTTLQNPKTPSFQDVTKRNQFYKQIETAKNYFITYKNKMGKLFKPDSYLTREDAMMAIAKVLGYDSDEAVSSNDNTDVSLEDIIDDAANVNPALVKYVAIGISNELMDLRISGNQLFFDPKKNITREDLAVLIYNAYQKKDYNAEEDSDKDGVIDNSDDTNDDSDTVTGDGKAGTDISEPIDTSKILSDDKAVEKMLNIKVGHTIALSDIDPSLKGYVTKVSSDPSSTPSFRYSSFTDSKLTDDFIQLGNISTNKKLEYGKESIVSFEYAYRVNSREKAAIIVGFNLNDYNNFIDKALWAVPKGSGVLVFRIPVTPKKWEETPFTVSAGMIDLASYQPLPMGYRVHILPTDYPERVNVY